MRKTILLVWLMVMLTSAGGGLHAQMTISTDTIVPTSTCPGGFMLIPFTVTNPNTNPGNVYYAEWSSIFGGFSNPDTVGSSPFIFGNSGFIPGQIPADAGLGIYQVRVVSSAPEVIGSPSPIPIIITVIPAAANITIDPDRQQCEGVPVTLTAGLGTGGDFAWSTGETTGSIVVSEPGNYSVTVTTLGCENISDPFTLNMLSRPAAPDVNLLANGELQSSPSTNYQWYWQGNTIPNATGQNYTPTQSGQYSVVTTGANGCPSLPSAPLFHFVENGGLVGTEPIVPRDTITNWLPVELAGSTSDTTVIPDLDYGLHVYPIPATDLLHIRFNTRRLEKVFYHIYDARGKTMFSSNHQHVHGNYHHQVDLSAFPAGFYSLQLFANGHLQHVNFLKSED